MWIYIAASNTAFNTAHIARLFVEETGAGAALKAELGGKPTMLAYYSSKADAQAALRGILEKQDAHAPVVYL